ncbi:cyanoexosortase B [Microcoleus sp. FACHB-1515]|uniref:cyanoexosortase B n=1 Tax=Cyanophyceae TaxID=3028117 RepID=UPI00168403DD|nr:cyanoexosortase B [Microcoleus sp. FACHB-1515]MBD2090437.1 cyanoexosortase B [Microcoleus sp. FACHB-1515]
MQSAILRPRSMLSAVLIGLIGLLYLPLLLHWADGWINKTISIEHEYFSHGLIGLPFAVLLAWERRDRWRQLAPAKSFAASSLGLALLLLSVACYFSQLADLINLSLPICLSGLCLWLKGQAGLRLQAFPLLLVWLATPTELPYLIAPYTLPLQRFIAGAAGFILLQFGLEVEVNQIYLFVNDRIVEVAPYCAGLKMLFTSLYVGLMLLYWRGAWRLQSISVTFFMGIILTSTIANIVRNTCLAFFHGTGRDRAFDWLHAGWGGDVYSAAMLGLLVLLLKGIEHWMPET